MNQDQLRGMWGQLKGKTKIIVGELTGDENRKAEGTIDKLYGQLQIRIGRVKQRVKAGIDKVRLP